MFGKKEYFNFLTFLRFWQQGSCVGFFSCKAAFVLEPNGAFEGLPNENVQGKAFVRVDETLIPALAFMTFLLFLSPLIILASTRSITQKRCQIKI